MKWASITFTAATMLTLQGCLTSETIETCIQLRGQEEPATIIIEYGNISSGEADTGDVRKDFQQIVDDWRGDHYLLDRTEEGMFVKNREVFIREGKIVARLTAIAKDMEKLQHKFLVNRGERVMLFDEDKDYDLVETNGRILRTEKNTLIVWPEEVSELRWKQRESKPSASSEANRPLMVQLLTEYLAGQAKTSPKP